MHKTGQFTTKDGNRLFEQSWEVDNPKGGVVIVHGLGEHSGRYAHVAANFNENGYSVYSYDHIGHGQSEGKKAYIESMSDVADDCGQFLDRTRLKLGKLPLFVLAHSMGGQIFAYLAVRELPKIDGVIFSAPALAAGQDISPTLIKVVKVLGRFVPKLPTQALEANGISRVQAEVDAYVNDPLVFSGALPARTGAEMMKAMEYVQAGTEKLTYPMLIVHGTADAMVDVEGSMRLHARVSSKDKTLKLFEGGYHESHNEPNRDEVLALYVEWMDARLDQVNTSSKSHHKKRAQQRKEA